MHYQGSCHCGRVKFEIDGTIEGAATCNCSICERKGAVMWFVPREQLKLLTPDASLKVRKGNYERIFDEGRRRVRAWEKANVR